MRDRMLEGFAKGAAGILFFKNPLAHMLAHCVTNVMESLCCGVCFGGAGWGNGVAALLK